ncbi:hypothetical protein MMC29_003371 [Sticta canariensis]|nr:hypothetical protein [Sticta canariensis]
MLFSALSHVGIFSSLIFHIYALPVKPQGYVDRSEAQKRASYSVVAVDGSIAVTTPSIQTVTQTLKDTMTVTASPIIPAVSKETVTEIVTQPSSTKVGLLPSDRSTTSTSSYRIVDSAGTTTPALDPTETTIVVPTSSIGSTRYSTPTMTIAPTTLTPSSQTTTQPCSSSWITSAVVFSPTVSSNSLQTSATTTSIYTYQQTTTSGTYDDGFWHTFYPYPNATSSFSSGSYDKGVVTALRSPAMK